MSRPPSRTRREVPNAGSFEASEVDHATSLTTSRRSRGMVERQLRRRGIVEPCMLDAFRAVPREAFISDDYADLRLRRLTRFRSRRPDHLAALYRRADDPGRGDQAGDRVLEVGAGSGYAAAVISRIAGQVIAIERQHELVEVARERLRRLGYDNVGSSKATVPWAGRTMRRSTRSWRRQAEAMCPKPDRAADAWWRPS